MDLGSGSGSMLGESRRMLGRPKWWEGLVNSMERMGKHVRRVLKNKAPWPARDI